MEKKNSTLDQGFLNFFKESLMFQFLKQLASLIVSKTEVNHIFSRFYCIINDGFLKNITWIGCLK